MSHPTPWCLTYRYPMPREATRPRPKPRTSIDLDWLARIREAQARRREPGRVVDPYRHLAGGAWD